MTLHERFGKRFQGAPGRNNLRQDFSAITVNIEHAFDRLNLTGNFAEPKLKSPRLISVMSVLVRRSWVKISKRL
jgi:hypothetical protein